jgi:hypothetical protein
MEERKTDGSKSERSRRMIRVIIVDDHPVVRRGLKQIIAAEQDMQVVGEALCISISRSLTSAHLLLDK